MAGTAPESGRPALSSVPERGAGAVDTVGAGGFNLFGSRIRASRPTSVDLIDMRFVRQNGRVHAADPCVAAPSEYLRSDLLDD